MRKPRRTKIKRYSHSFSGNAERGLFRRRVLGFVAGLAVLFGVGWLVAEPAINFTTAMWYSIKQSFSENKMPNTSQSMPQSESTSEPIQSESTPAPQPVEQLQSAQGNWAYVALSAIDTPEKAAQTAHDLAAQGIKCAIMQLKDERGYLYYQSNVSLAKQQIAERTIDAAQIAQVFADNGIIPIAAINAFNDGLTSKADRTAAVTYNGQEGFLWLDNKPELGGNSWLSPYSNVAKQYIQDLISELLGFGFKQIIVSGAQYPDGYGLETAVFAPATDTRTRSQALADCITAWQVAANDNEAQLWLEYSVETIFDNENKKTYGSPFELGAKCMLINFSNSVQDGENGKEMSHELFGAAIAKAAQNKSPKLAMTMGGGALETEVAYAAAAAARDAGFESFVVR